jgi:MFS family permease
VAQLLNAVSFGAVLLLLSLYFQIVLGMDALAAGLLIIPLDIVTVVLGPLSGKLSDRYGHLPFTTGGLVLVSISLFLFATTDVNTPVVLLIAYMAIFGAGLGIFASPNMSSIMGSVPSVRRGIASAFRATFFNMGFVISLNLAILIMTFTIRYDLVSQIISSTNPVAIPEADKVLFADSLKSTYFWMGVLNTLAIIPSMLRGRRARAGGAAGEQKAPSLDM